MKSGARWMTKENGKRLIIRVIHRVLQGLRDFALRAAPLHLRSAGLKSLRALPPYGYLKRTEKQIIRGIRISITVVGYR